MRPRGEIRQAMCRAAAAVAAECAALGRPVALTWLDLAHRAQVGREKARRTVCDMAAAGELHEVDRVRVPPARRPMVRYAPSATLAQQQWSATGWETPATLNTLLGQWRG